MKKHGGNVMAGLLADYGVTAVFGVPGFVRMASVMLLVT